MRFLSILPAVSFRLFRPERATALWPSCSVLRRGRGGRALTFNCLEFEVIELGVVEMLPQAQETDGVPRPHPVLDNISRILGRPVFGYVCQGNEISGGAAIAHLHLQAVCIYVNSFRHKHSFSQN